jgi:hypothetical protein
MDDPRYCPQHTSGPPCPGFHHDIVDQLGAVRVPRRSERETWAAAAEMTLAMIAVDGTLECLLELFQARIKE